MRDDSKWSQRGAHQDISKGSKGLGRLGRKEGTTAVMFRTLCSFTTMTEHTSCMFPWGMGNKRCPPLLGPGLRLESQKRFFCPQGELFTEPQRLLLLSVGPIPPPQPQLPHGVSRPFLQRRLSGAKKSSPTPGPTWCLFGLWQHVRRGAVGSWCEKTLC